jgi:hypothetical protein
MRSALLSTVLAIVSPLFGGAMPRRSYLETIEAAGFRVEDVRTNDYPFTSDLALDAGLESISVAAVRETSRGSAALGVGRSPQRSTGPATRTLFA